MMKRVFPQITLLNQCIKREFLTFSGFGQSTPSIRNPLIVGHGALYKVFLENKKVYNKADLYWTLMHRPPLIAEFNTLESGWRIDQANLED